MVKKIGQGLRRVVTKSKRATALMLATVIAATSLAGYATYAWVEDARIPEWVVESGRLSWSQKVENMAQTYEGLYTNDSLKPTNLGFVQGTFNYQPGNVFPYTGVTWMSEIVPGLKPASGFDEKYQYVCI